MTDNNAAGAIAAHGASLLPAVTVDSYNLEIRDEDDEFIGDRASNRAFRKGLDEIRNQAFGGGEDPFGKDPAVEISKKVLDKALVEGDLEQSGAVFAAVEEFAQSLAAVIRRFMKRKDWQDSERLAIGGGLRASRVGELAIGRAGILLKQADIDVELRPIRHDPDEAGLVGAVHLAPSWMFSGHDALLAIDIGGTNFRAGLVRFNMDKADDLSKAAVVALEHWRHRDDDPSREEAVKRLVKMLNKLIGEAEKEKLALAPFIGIGCPGMIAEDGSIDRGSQNLPGNWTSSRFHLPSLICEAIPEIGGHGTHVVMHNDAVVQGLSEVPFMKDVERWGMLTIGTGLGNAHFTNRERAKT